MARSSSKRRSARRSQSDILLETLRCVPNKKPQSINRIAKKCNSTWRTTKKTLVALEKAGVVRKEKSGGRKRAKYVRK